MRFNSLVFSLFAVLFSATLVQAASLPKTAACRTYSNYAHGMPPSVTRLNQLYQACMRSGKRQKNVRRYQCGKGQYRYKYNGSWRCGKKTQPDIAVDDAISILGIAAGFLR